MYTVEHNTETKRMHHTAKCTCSGCTPIDRQLRPQCLNETPLATRELRYCILQELNFMGHTACH